jgi:hypothetical protein
MGYGSPSRRKLVVGAIVITALLTAGVIVALNTTAGPTAPSPRRFNNGQLAPTCADVGNHDSGAADPLWYGPFRSAYELQVVAPNWDALATMIRRAMCTRGDRV